MALYQALRSTKTRAWSRVNPLIVTKEGQPRRARCEDQHRRERASTDNALEALRDEIAGRSDGARRESTRPRLRHSSTATSLAWSTAPDSRWRPWTSSSCYGGTPGQLPRRGRRRDRVNASPRRSR
jgi:hypothetical protein